MRDDAITRHFFNGFIRLHVLYHAAKEPVYGAEITEELIRHGYRLSQGTLYPTLHLLEQLGYLAGREEVVGRRREGTSRATAAGRKVLAAGPQATPGTGRGSCRGQGPAFSDDPAKATTGQDNASPKRR